MAMNNLAYILSERAQDLEFALNLADRALEKEPDQHNLLDTKGWILYKLGRLQEALQFVSKAASMDEESETNDKGRHLKIIKEAIELSTYPQK